MLKHISFLTRRQSLFCLREFCAVGAPSLTKKCLIFAENKGSAAPLLQKFDSVDLCRRSYAKNRDRKRDRNKKLQFNISELKEYFDADKLLEDLEKPVETFKQELMKHANLRTSAGAIETLKVDFEGEKYTIQDLAEVGKKNPRLYVLDFSAFPSAIPTVLKALQNSELNLNVQQEGNKVIVPIPKVTKEHRQLLTRRSKLYFVKCKEGIRDVQMRYIKSLGKQENLPSEEKFRLTNQLTSLGDSQIQEAEEILKAKQHDLMNEEEAK